MELDFKKPRPDTCSMLSPKKDGAYLPRRLCGTNETGEAGGLGAAWSLQWWTGAGRSLGLIETAEKAAEIYMKIAHLS